MDVDIRVYGVPYKVYVVEGMETKIGHCKIGYEKHLASTTTKLQVRHAHK